MRKFDGAEESNLKVMFKVNVTNDVPFGKISRKISETSISDEVVKFLSDINITLIEERTRKDKYNIERLCKTYWKSPNIMFSSEFFGKVDNFFLDEKKRLGWCVNPKGRYMIIARWQQYI